MLEDLPVPICYSVIFYFMAGFRAQAGQFFTFLAVQLLLHLIAVNLATVCIALNRQFMIASLYANISFTIQSMGCGFFVSTHSISVWLRWIKWVAYVVSDYLCKPLDLSGPSDKYSSMRSVHFVRMNSTTDFTTVQAPMALWIQPADHTLEHIS